MSEAAISHYLSEFERFKCDQDPGWLPEQRTEALAYLKNNGFPTRKKEKWKYTDLAPLCRREFTLQQSAPAQVDEASVDDLRLPGLACIDLVFVNGLYSAALSNLKATPAGAVICSLAEAKTARADRLEQLLHTASENIDHAFTALNLAFLNDGALICIPDGVEVKRPVNIIYLSNNTGPTMSHPRNVIALGRGSKTTIIETYVGMEDVEYFTNTHTQVLAEDNAHLDYYKIQQEGRRAYHIGNTKITQRRDSKIDCHSLSFGGALARSDMDVVLDGPGAEIHLNGLYLTNGRQHMDNQTLIEHKQPHTGSHEHYRGVLNGRSRAVFNGKVIVHERAQKTEAHQSNANLLLSGEAEVNTKPELEIYADDVKCNHGATVGQLDDNMLFYLRSRAIDKNTAKSLLIYAFADEVMRDMKLPDMRARLERSVAGGLPDADLIKAFMR